jgi:hypothetical protein
MKKRIRKSHDTVPFKGFSLDIRMGSQCRSQNERSESEEELKMV